MSCSELVCQAGEPHLWLYCWLMDALFSRELPLPTDTCGFSGGSVVKNLSASAGDVRDLGLIPGLGRSPGGGHGNPLQYSCLENPKDRGAWWTIVYRVRKSQRQLKWLSMQRNTNLVSFNCTTSWCFLESDLFWSKTAIKVMLDLLLSF